MASACFTLSTHFMLSIGTCNTTSCRHRNILERVPFAMTYGPRSWLQIIIIALGWWHDVFNWDSRLTLSIISLQKLCTSTTLEDDKHTYECRYGLSLDILLRICVWLRKQQTLDCVQATKQRSRCVQNISAPLIGLDRVICLSHTNGKRFIAKDHRNWWQWPLIFIFFKNLEWLKTTYGKHVAASAIWNHSIIVVVAGMVAVRATMEQLQICTSTECLSSDLPYFRIEYHPKLWQPCANARLHTTNLSDEPGHRLPAVSNVLHLITDLLLPPRLATDGMLQALQMSGQAGGEWAPWEVDNRDSEQT